MRERERMTGGKKQDTERKQLAQRHIEAPFWVQKMRRRRDKKKKGRVFGTSRVEELFLTCWKIT